MTLEENESHAIWDYASDQVTVFTTRRGVANKIQKRLKGVKNEIIFYENECEGDTTWKIKIPMKYCRDAFVVSNVEK